LTLVPKFPPKRLIIDYNYPLDTLSKSDPRFSKMEIELFVNGRKVTARTIDKDGSDQIAADVSQLAISAGDDVEIHIVADKALMPSEHGINDKRLLSMIVSKIYFESLLEGGRDPIGWHGEPLTGPTSLRRAPELQAASKRSTRFSILQRLRALGRSLHRRS
jgi:hypothetical protein